MIVHPTRAAILRTRRGRTGIRMSPETRRGAIAARALLTRSCMSRMLIANKAIPYSTPLPHAHPPPSRTRCAAPSTPPGANRSAARQARLAGTRERRPPPPAGPLAALPPPGPAAPRPPARCKREHLGFRIKGGAQCVAAGRPGSSSSTCQLNSSLPTCHAQAQALKTRGQALGCLPELQARSRQSHFSLLVHLACVHRLQRAAQCISQARNVCAGPVMSEAALARLRGCAVAQCGTSKYLFGQLVCAAAAGPSLWANVLATGLLVLRTAWSIYT